MTIIRKLEKLKKEKENYKLKNRLLKFTDF